MVYKMVDGIIVAHQNGKGIMPWDSQQGTSNRSAYPFVTSFNQISDILHGGKAQTNRDRIYDTIEMLVKKGITTKDEP